MNQGKLDQAIAHFSEALRVLPNYAEAHNNLGVALGQQGKFDEAAKHFSEAVRVKPDYTDAQNNLKLAVASQRSAK